jgi:hypothetical protein
MSEMISPKLSLHLSLAGQLFEVLFSNATTLDHQQPRSRIAPLRLSPNKPRRPDRSLLTSFSPTILDPGEEEFDAEYR